MRVSEHWLRTFINPHLTIKKIGELLTLAGVEVDSIEKIELLFPKTPKHHKEKVVQININKENNSALHDISDTVVALKTPANRGDCLSMEGIAREVSALTREPYTSAQIKPSIPKIVDFFPIRIDSQNACPRYIGRIIQNINPNAATPEWMQNRLQSAGLRPISPVVDVTNYVMLELGQPLHAFDLTEIDSEIIVRFAKKGERIITLDHLEIELNEKTLVVADKSKPLAIAGIIGGVSSSVSEKTENIFLECAYFDPVTIRFTARHFGFRTESSIRFERGVDHNLQTRAIERATELLESIVGGNIGPLIEKSAVPYLPVMPTVLLRRERLKHLLGLSIQDHEIKDILNRLEISYLQTEDGFLVTVPSFRVDLGQEEDIIEEIIRIYGYHHVPTKMPTVSAHFWPVPEDRNSPQRFKQELSSRGYCEVITYSFVSPELIKLIYPDQKALELENPISSDMAAMRNGLWPGLIQTCLYNQRRQQERIRIYEMGTCFFQEEPDKTGKELMWVERQIFSGLCSGPEFAEQWGTQPRICDFYDVKADLEALFSITGHEVFFKFMPASHPALHPGQTAAVYLKDKKIGWIASLNPKLLKQLDWQGLGNIIVFELNADELFNKTVPQFKEYSKYPAIRRDIAIVVDKNIMASDLKSAIVKEAGALLRDVLIFDVYQGKGISLGSKSIALGLILQHPSRTLVDFEVNEVVEKVLNTLKLEFHAQLRE